MKVLVIGNCQARQLGNLIAKYTHHDVLEPIILQLSKEAEAQEHQERIAQADLVLAQATAPGFLPAHLRSDLLKQTGTSRVLVWPNVFFVGQHPYLRYLTHSQFGRVLGPMEATHDMRIVNAWFQSRKGETFNPRLAEAGYEQWVYDTSIRELRGREEQCDVIISDLIETHFQTQRLFFTFNHPSLWLLTRLAERILTAAGEDHAIDPADMKEPLSLFQPPWRFMDDTPLQGLTVDLGVAEKVTLGKVRAYTQADFEEAAFACYDHLAAQMEVSALRTTPGY
jgi:hypothetical protein